MLVELGEYNEARLWSDKALELFRNNGDLLAVKATACLRAGDGRAAHECSDASIASPGSSPVRWRGRGEVILNKAASRARDCFEKSLAEPQADWFDRVAIARVYLFHRQPAAAAQYAQSAVELQSGHAYCWYVLARCQEALGWTDRALESYGRAVQLSPELQAAGDALRTLSRSSGFARMRNWLGGLLSR
jgi:predicted Zn-dependent protease